MIINTYHNEYVKITFFCTFHDDEYVWYANLVVSFNRRKKKRNERLTKSPYVNITRINRIYFVLVLWTILLDYHEIKQIVMTNLLIWDR